MVISDRKDGSSKKLIEGYSELPLSVYTVLSNDDLLIEILLRSPVLSLLLFKSVSKYWLSLIKFPDFITKRNKTSNSDPPSGLLIRKYKRSEFDFYESFDIRIPSKYSSIFTSGFGLRPRVGRVEILQSCNGFNEGIYWNGAIHRLNTNILDNWIHYKLDVMNEHPVLTTIQLPETLDKKSHVRFKLFESRGCLLLLGKDYAHSQHLNIYEMRNGYVEWSVKYFVNLDDIMKPIPDIWRIPKGVWCIVLGEREEDSFMIFDLLSKVLQYNPASKTVRTLSGLKPYFDSFQFIPSFAEV